MYHPQSANVKINHSFKQLTEFAWLPVFQDSIKMVQLFADPVMLGVQPVLMEILVMFVLMDMT